MNFQYHNSKIFGPSIFLKSCKSNMKFLPLKKKKKIRAKWEADFAMSQIWQKKHLKLSSWKYIIAAESLRKSISFWHFFLNVGIKI